MALTWDDKEKELANINMMIAGVTGQGGSPGQLYKPPVTNPGRGEAVFGVEKGGQGFFEFLKAMGILYPTRWPKNDPNAGKAPFDNKGNDLSAPVPGHPDWAGTNKDMKIANQSQFNSFMNRFKAGSSNPKSPSLNHHSPEAQKLILNTALRIRGA